MTILSAATLDTLRPLRPWHLTYKLYGVTGGLSTCGYDIALAQRVVLPVGAFALASSVEEFHMPLDVVGIIHDKSTWARRGVAVQNTVIEPGWRGFLTLELTNHGVAPLVFQEGTPIAQVLFHRTDHPTQGYAGKYQDQPPGPQAAKEE